jgi:hypothetical protein
MKMSSGSVKNILIKKQKQIQTDKNNDSLEWLWTQNTVRTEVKSGFCCLPKQEFVRHLAEEGEAGGVGITLQIINSFPHLIPGRGTAPDSVKY